jgi:uncharacterized protein (DUF2235 family)
MSMKRLVICCDGTWNRPDDARVTNIEKIARTIETDPIDGSPPAQQMVLYLSGVGTNGYVVDRLLGGAFGLGLFENISSAYRFLALNYDPGDEIFVFGFSRGAYTARSLVGMIGCVGLLTRESVISGHLPEAVRRYRRRRPDRRAFHGASDERFREVNSHHDVRVRFLGVFDTVGALGVPGAIGRAHQFHDVTLSPQVENARHAVAIDEHRIKFEPALWECPAAGSEPTHGRQQSVKQVWFEGAHSDVGGGYDETGLSDTALGWMVREAEQAGLAFDEKLLATYLDCGSSAVRHESLTPFYRLLNGTSRLRLALRRRAPGHRHFIGHERVLGYEPGLSLMLASSAAEHHLVDASRSTAAGGRAREAYSPDNLRRFAEGTADFVGCTEQVDVRPRRPGPARIPQQATGMVKAEAT